MSDSNTSTDEKILWDGSVSHWHYAGKWLLIIFLLGVLIATFFIQSVDNQTILLSIRGLVALAILILIGWISLDRSKRKYLVTNRRVSVEYGIVSTRSNELRIQDIRSINLTTTGLSGLIGIGRLEFSSAATDDAEVTFWNTPNAATIRDMVRSLQTVGG